MAWKANNHQNNAYEKYSLPKTWSNWLVLETWDFILLSWWFVFKASPWSNLEWVSLTTKTFALDNQTQAKEQVQYEPIKFSNTYILTPVNGSLIDSMVWWYFDMDASQDLDVATYNTSFWQFRLERIMPNGDAEITINRIWLGSWPAWPAWSQWATWLNWATGDLWPTWATWPQWPVWVGTPWPQGATWATWPAGSWTTWATWATWPAWSQWATGATWPAWTSSNSIAHIESFVATLNQTAFVLANTPASNNFVWVSLSTWAYGKQDAIYDYTVSGNTVTLNNPASAGDVITVQYVENLGALTSVTVANIWAWVWVIANPWTASSFDAKSITTSGIWLTLTPSATEINVETNTLAKIVYVTNGMSPYTALWTEELIVADTTWWAVTIDLNGTPSAVPTKTKIHRLGTWVVTVQASWGSWDFNVVWIDTINLNSNGTSIEVISLWNPWVWLVNFLTTAFVWTTYNVASPIISIS